MTIKIPVVPTLQENTNLEDLEPLRVENVKILSNGKLTLRFNTPVAWDRLIPQTDVAHQGGDLRLLQTEP